jgi:hypothetical protein
MAGATSGHTTLVVVVTRHGARNHKGHPRISLQTTNKGSWQQADALKAKLTFPSGLTACKSHAFGYRTFCALTAADAAMKKLTPLKVPRQWLLPAVGDLPLFMRPPYPTMRLLHGYRYRYGWPMLLHLLREKFQ